MGYVGLGVVVGGKVYLVVLKLGVGVGLGVVEGGR